MNFYQQMSISAVNGIKAKDGGEEALAEYWRINPDVRVPAQLPAMRDWVYYAVDFFSGEVGEYLWTNHSEWALTYTKEFIALCEPSASKVGFVEYDAKGEPKKWFQMGSFATRVVMSYMRNAPAQVTMEMIGLTPDKYGWLHDFTDQPGEPDIPRLLRFFKRE